MKELLKPVIVLTIICIITSGLLGATYNVTAPLIAESEKRASDAAMEEVLPAATAFTEVQVDNIEGLLLAAKDENGAGWAFKVQDKGFGGAYVIMVGISSDGTITGTKLLDNAETPGLGSKTGMPSFTEQFIGQNNELEGVETITGATISSKAFIRAVGTAYTAFEAVGEGA